MREAVRGRVLVAMGLGYPLPSGSMLHRQVLEQADTECKKWVYNLSMRLVANNNGTIYPRASRWRIDEVNTEHEHLNFGKEVADCMRARRLGLSLADATRVEPGE